jgi:uncharacterized protein (TIGR03118 family)
MSTFNSTVVQFIRFNASVLMRPTRRSIQHHTLALACLGLATMLLSSIAVAQYQLKNLVSNQVKQAAHTDPLLVNAWGLVHRLGSPWWVSDNNSGWSTLYDGSGKQVTALKVLIPTAGNGPGSPTGLNGPGSPTGVVSNVSNDFQVQGWAPLFLFATLDGTISGWSPQANRNEAIQAVDNSANKAVYTGLAITSRTSGNLLYAADNANGHVDMYDASFTLVKSFTDTSLPAGFAPFGIADIGGLVYVTFASTTGGSGGFVDQFTEDGTQVGGKSLIQGAPLNQPWGIAAAPPNFGPLSNTLLISNNTNGGTINAFNATTGAFVSTVKDTNNKQIKIDQLWGIGFGDGTGANGGANQLFFTAGPANNLAGTLGKIVFVKD